MISPFEDTKSDQAGETTSKLKSICANPYKPDICVILRLDFYIFAPEELKNYFPEMK